jgi:hypothetical protein
MAGGMFDPPRPLMTGRRPSSQREIDMLDELCHVAIGGLIDGTLALISDDA